VTGVSGGGKSTLTVETLYKALARRLNNAREQAAPFEKPEGDEFLDKIVDIDQSPIGRTPRSNPATYTGCFTPIRDWFAGLPEAKARGYLPGRFSFNVKGGRCEACQGDGVIKIEMHFLPDVYVQCDVCHGKRYNRETLEVLFRGKSIADVLDMTVDEGAEFFRAVPAIREKLVTLQRVGLGYIHVGQPATTLSGGEAQRGVSPPLSQPPAVTEPTGGVIPDRHCEEQSDEAISTPVGRWPSRLLRFARNDSQMGPLRLAARSTSPATRGRNRIFRV